MLKISIYQDNKIAAKNVATHFLDLLKSISFSNN